MKYLLTMLFISVNLTISFSQTDSLVFKDGSYLVGEIKSMDRGVLKVKTNFSKSDFNVKWEEVKELYTPSLFLFSTTENRRLYGRISTDEYGDLIIQLADSTVVNTTPEDIIFIQSLNQGFRDRLYAGIDLGFTLTKSQNQRQFSFRSQAGYLSEKWSIDYALNNIISSRDDVEDIRRGDGSITLKYVLPREWFLIARNEFLYNNEQLLDLRSNTLFGLGKYLIRNNYLYWSIYSGATYNNENYRGEGNDRNSGEAMIGGELNLFDIEDFSLLVNIIAYPSLTESRRLRIDNRIDLQYDLPLDFYIKTGFTLNYDNQPVAGAAQSDYIWQTTFGWSW